MRGEIQSAFLAIPVDSEFSTSATIWLLALLSQIIMRLITMLTKTLYIVKPNYLPT